ncbi:hypothetical protein EGR_11218 [Echinococcus granulosus]|uniref:Uncharacterized protein n=1 Tax=Echinococcus granulosus TaxID=6210 RepID=W6TYR3_ECHGR|nr:hypothetical protein EGR_11218 [Echinococcus granulosus]EUB53925.1 hypothetical protein EGR_11218 [Echinococcus granulosus]
MLCRIISKEATAYEQLRTAIQLVIASPSFIPCQMLTSKPKSCTHLILIHPTKDFISTRPGVARFEINPGWDMLHDDVIEVTTGDTLRCVNTGTPKLEAAIQLDFSNENDVEFAGAFVTEGTHFVIAVLESYAWEQLAPPKLIKLPIRVIPLHMKAAAVLNSTESPIFTTGGQLSRGGTDLGRIVGFRFSFLGG